MNFRLQALVLAAVLLPLAKATPLYNRSDLTGWKFVTVAGESDPGTVAKVDAGGVLHVAGKPTGYLLAPGGPYGRFRLHAEYRWEAPKGNSGFFVYVASGPKGGKPWPTCLQIQNRDQHTGELIPMGGFTFENGPPDGKPLALRHPPEEMPLGDWNTCDVVCNGPDVEVRVNGVLQNTAAHCSVTQGGVALQLEGHPFQVRTLDLTPIDD